MSVRARLAPTPSGYLHWGNLLNFTLTWVHTRRAGGKLALRIDDLDAARARPEYLEDIFSTLTWLGFEWDEGPHSAEEFQRHFTQTARTEEYRRWLTRFAGYACDCSRQEIRARTSLTYDGHCRERGLRLEKDITQWRLRAPQVENDVVLWRKEDAPAYHLVSLVEDLRLGTNLIIRGLDLYDSSEVQKLLAQQLGSEGESFLKAHFIHHPLLLDETGAKMSKSEGAEALKTWRAQGHNVAETFRELARRAGWPKEVDSLASALIHL